MTLMLRRLIIDKFRGFKHLELNGLGRVNVLVGTNNSGKTSVLEAIQLLLSYGHLGSIYSTLFRRGEQLLVESERRLQPEADICRLFHDYELEVGSLFTIIGTNNSSEKKLSATISETPPQSTSSGTLRQTSLFGDEPEYMKPYWLVLRWDGADNIEEALPISPRGGLPMTEVMRRPGRQNGGGKNIRFIPTASLAVDEVVALFEESVLTPEEDLVIEALRTIEPTIERIASVGIDRPYYRNYPGVRGGIVVKCVGVPARIPIGSMGDGMWRMLGLALALVHAKGGVVLVDEIDTGLHFTVMADMWELVAKTAARLGVQVFATTHSSDCWTSLAEVARNSVSIDSEISIQRIERGKPRAVAFTEQEIVIAASRDIEIR
jgi:hypothetical protein